MRSDLALYDAMHPACREALRNAPFDFDLNTMPKTAINHAIGAPRPSPGRFIAWLKREVEVKMKESDHA